MDALFVPGFAAPAALYRPLLPAGWTALEPPSFASSAGTLAAYRTWLRAELSQRGACVLGGHSMGGALALLAAAAEPELVERLVLVSPAGLPLTKPIRQSVADFARQLMRGLYPYGVALQGARSLLRAPSAALRLAHEVRALDLRWECARIRERGVRALVVGCRTDSLVRAADAETLAHALGAEYVELDVTGGHMWMLGDRARLASVLTA